jgi:hypothetical protein
MRKIITLFLLFTFFTVSAQQSSVGKKYRIPKVILKWSPLHCLDWYPTFQFAIEHRFAKNFSLQYDFGPVINVGGFDMNSDRDKHGFKARLQGRRYFAMPSNHWELFMGPELHYNNISYQMGETYIVHPSSGIEYYEFLVQNRKFTDKGFDFNVGTIFKVYRFIIDFQVGISARSIKYSAPRVVPDSQTYEYESKHSIIEPIRDNRNLISPTGCVRFCYIIL